MKTRSIVALLLMALVMTMGMGCLNQPSNNQTNRTNETDTTDRTDNITDIPKEPNQTELQLRYAENFIALHTEFQAAMNKLAISMRAVADEIITKEEYNERVMIYNATLNDLLNEANSWIVPENCDEVHSYTILMLEYATVEMHPGEILGPKDILKSSMYIDLALAEAERLSNLEERK